MNKLKKMNLTKNFKLEEFVSSPTARAKDINNTPSRLVIDNLKHLCEGLLQPLRNKFGYSMSINSGYRCEELNKAVGGVYNSQHMLGEAADVRCYDPVHLLDTLKMSGLEFDQAILYPTFLHLSLKPENSDVENRKQIIIK